jgi:hypothetical protein
MDRARFAPHSGAEIFRRVVPLGHGRRMAPTLAIVGAGIQMSPNAMRVLRGIGLEERIRLIQCRRGPTSPSGIANRYRPSGAPKLSNTCCTVSYGTLPTSRSSPLIHASPKTLILRWNDYS